MRTEAKSPITTPRSPGQLRIRNCSDSAMPPSQMRLQHDVLGNWLTRTARATTATWLAKQDTSRTVGTSRRPHHFTHHKYSARGFSPTEGLVIVTLSRKFKGRRLQSRAGPNRTGHIALIECIVLGVFEDGELAEEAQKYGLGLQRRLKKRLAAGRVLIGQRSRPREHAALTELPRNRRPSARLLRASGAAKRVGAQELAPRPWERPSPRSTKTPI